MNTVDAAFLFIILLSVLLGIIRGLVAEILSILSLIASVWVANHYAGDLAPWISMHVALPNAQYAMAFIVLYGAMWLVTATISYFIHSIIGALGLGWLDRCLGTLFGLTRGVCIVLIIVLIVGLTPIPQQPFWQEAMLTASAEHAIEVLRPLLSDALQKHVDYKPATWINHLKDLGNEAKTKIEDMATQQVEYAATHKHIPKSVPKKHKHHQEDDSDN